MKVLMFGWEFPPHISGGLGTACYGLTKGMTHLKDMEIIFVVPKAFGDENPTKIKLIGANNVAFKKQEVKYEEVLKKIQYIEVNSNIIPYTKPEEYFELRSKHEKESKGYVNIDYHGTMHFTGEYGPGLFQEIADYAIVASVIGTENDFDVIHAHDWLTYPAGIAAKQVSGKPLVIHVHATDFDRSGGSVNPAVYEIEKKGMDAADRIITVSNLTKQIVVNNYHIDPAKVVTVYNAVEPVVEREHIFINKGFTDKIVTFLGRITVQKGPEYYIEAANKVLQKMDNVRFVMAGSGDLMDRMITRAASLGITDRFHFTGFLRNNDVYQMFYLSDVYVMPSVSEPFGISPLEAMHSKVPVIISNQSGVAEILSHAIKIDFWDIDAMADAIYGILNYEALSKIFKRLGKSEVDNLKWENSAANVKKVYEWVI